MLDFHGVIDDQVHEFVEPLLPALAPEFKAAFDMDITDPNLALDANGQLLVQPDTNCGILMKQKSEYNPSSVRNSPWSSRGRWFDVASWRWD